MKIRKKAFETWRDVKISETKKEIIELERRIARLNFKLALYNSLTVKK